MMYARKSAGKKKTYKKRTSVKYSKKSVKPTKNLTKAIKQVVFKQAETKHTPIDEAEYAFTSNNIMSPSVNLSNTFVIANGTADGQRIGNKINCTKAVINLIIRRNDSASSLIPCEVHIFFGYLKQSRDSSPDGVISTSLYQDGPSVTSWNGTMTRTMRQINKDAIICYKKLIVKIAPSTSSSSQFNNNDFPALVRKRINLTPMLGTITYGDDGNTANFNKDLFMWASYVYINDAINDLVTSPNLKPIDLFYWMDTEYKDM